MGAPLESLKLMLRLPTCPRFDATSRAPECLGCKRPSRTALCGLLDWLRRTSRRRLESPLQALTVRTLALLGRSGRRWSRAHAHPGALKPEFDLESGTPPAEPPLEKETHSQASYTTFPKAFLLCVGKQYARPAAPFEQPRSDIASSLRSLQIFATPTRSFTESGIFSGRLW